MKIGIVGTGNFGSSFAALLLKNGFDITISDKDESKLKSGLQAISSHLAQMAKKGVISITDRELLMHKIRESTDNAVHKEADIIIEAVSERPAAKKDAFASIEKIARPDAILATASSSISVDSIARNTKSAERIAGIHIVDPASSSAMEIISGKQTSPKTVRTIRLVFDRIFTVIETNSPIASKLIFGMINEAAYCVRDGATPDSVDALMKLGASHPTGPLELADSIGIDVVVETLNNMRNKSEKFKPCPLLIQMTKEGKLGKKVEKGFYDYMK